MQRSGLAAREALLPPLPAAVVTVAADAALTGGLHLDGLTDAADGLLAHLPEKERLAIMAEPAIGTFGALVLALALRPARGSVSRGVEPSPTLLAALWCCSRSLMAVGSSLLPYAREDGLATALLAGADGGAEALRAGLLGIAAAAALATVVRGRRGLGGVLAGTLAGAGALAAQRRLGGFTGESSGQAACSARRSASSSRR